MEEARRGRGKEDVRKSGQKKRIRREEVGRQTSDFRNRSGRRRNEKLMC